MLAGRYLWGPSVDQLLAEEHDAGGDVSWTLGDDLNSVRDWLHYNGTIDESAAYDAFDPDSGLPVGPAATERLFSYTGRLFDGWPMTSRNAQNARNEIVSIAKSMVAGEMSLIVGARRLCDLRHEIGASDSNLFNPIVGFESETDEFPLGSQREGYSKETLATMDEELAGYVAEARATVISSCNAIIAALENPAADH